MLDKDDSPDKISANQCSDFRQPSRELANRALVIVL